MDKDLAYMWKEIKHKVKMSKNDVIGLIAELEIKVDKLALNLAKHEAPPNSGSSSSSKGKFNWELWAVFCVAWLVLPIFPAYILLVS